MDPLTRGQRETLEELNRRAKKMAREARPAYRIRHERWVVAYRIMVLILLMTAVMVGLAAWLT